MIRFTIEGKPHVQKRPRVMRGGWTYDPCVKEKKAVATIALVALQGAKSLILKGDLRLKASFYGCRANGDLSNYLKLVEDACNGILYLDDKQIMEIVAKKVHKDDHPRTEVEIEEIT